MTGRAAPTAANSFTVDVEDWFQVSAFRHHIRREDWPTREWRLDRTMDRLLALMAEAGVRATCFVLGWAAERAPDLVRRIAVAGHEIASHGYAHELVYDLTPTAFRELVHRSVETLRDVSGQPVIGFRAASFSLPRGDRQWVYEILAAEGLRYDSSIFPIRRRFYGHPEAPWAPYDVLTPAGRVREFPLPVISLFGQGMPFGGGGYFRLYPYRLTRAMLRRANAAGRPVVVYVHPWELDTGQPRQPVNAITRFRHYNHIDRVEGRLRRLWTNFTFTPLGERLNHA